MRRATCLWLACLSLVSPTLARAQLLTRLSTPRAIAALTSPEAHTRTDAAERLSLQGTHDHVAPPLRTAIEHEAVPEVLAALLTTLARRAEASDLPALEAAWDRTATSERRLVVSALDALGGEALPLLRRHLASEGIGPRACAALVRSDERVAWLASTLEEAALRDRVVSCLASAAPSDVRDAALLRAGIELEPMAAREVLAALARSAHVGPAAIVLAETALGRPDVTLHPAALALLARHAPERLPVERWQTWLVGSDERAGSAIRALLAVAPEAADAALADFGARDEAAARRALAVLIDRNDGADLARVAAFARVPGTREAALDHLARSDGGAALLVAMPPSPDVDVALAMSAPTGAARDALLARSPPLVLRALIGDASAHTCAAAGGLEGAACLALMGPEGATLAARALATERDPAVVAWLALAAADAPVDPEATLALIEDDATRLAALALAPAAIGAAPAALRRAIESRIVRATTDPDELARAEAVRAIGVLGRVVHRAVVLRALEDPSAQVRLAAARALAGVSVGPADLRVVGRTHVESDARVLSTLRGEPLGVSGTPLHVRVVSHDPATADEARVELRLADGRSLRLAPVRGELLVRGAPDAPAIVQLATTARH